MSEEHKLPGLYDEELMKTYETHDLVDEVVVAPEAEITEVTSVEPGSYSAVINLHKVEVCLGLKAQPGGYVEGVGDVPDLQDLNTVTISVDGRELVITEEQDDEYTNACKFYEKLHDIAHKK